MKKGMAFGAGIGFALMFFLDPKCGKHRRLVASRDAVWLGKHIGKGVAWPLARIF